MDTKVLVRFIGFTATSLAQKASLVLVVLAVCLTVSAAYAFKEDIVGAWTFDEGEGDVVNDLSGNENHGNRMGKAEWVQGKFNSPALRLEDDSTYVEIPFSDSLNVHEGDLTFAAWVKLDEIAAHNMVLFVQTDVGATGRNWLEANTASSTLVSYLGGGAKDSGFKVEVDTWYHVAVVVANGSLQIYVNGKPEGDTWPVSVEPSKGEFRIGRHKKDSGEVWPGVVDEVVLVRKALSQAEIETLMIKGLAVNLGLAVNASGKLATNWGNIKAQTS